MKRLLLTLMVSLLAVPFIYAQDDEEEEIVISAPAPAQEESAEFPAPGWAINVGGGVSLASGEYVTTDPSGIGVVVGTPYVMPLGPLDINFSVSMLMNSGMQVGGGTDVDLTQISANAGAFIPGLPVQAWLGIGTGGSGMGMQLGAGVPVNAFMPDLPVIVTVGGMANILTKVNDDAPGNTGVAMGFLMVGMPLPIGN